MAFVRSLAIRTGAIRELRELRPPLLQTELERDANLRETIANSESRHIEISWMSLSSETLINTAGISRFMAAGTWLNHWNLNQVRWLQKWGTFALLWWTAAGWCTKADCSQGCAAVNGQDDALALELVLTKEMLVALEAGDGVGVSVTSQVDEGAGAQGGRIICGGVDQLPASVTLPMPLLGPSPMLETRDEFFQRADIAWAEAMNELEREGYSVIVPRQLERHCDWLVRYQVLEQTAADIVSDAKDTDPSTVHKAVRTIARLLEIPIRTT